MTSTANLSPLEQIQHAERTCSQTIREAQLEAEERKKAARQHAAKLNDDARVLGRQQGQQDYHAAIELAQQEAQAIIEQARARAEQLAQHRDASIDTMIDQIVALIRGSDES